ncbi:MAG: DinB family protein, partial [Terriglobales bacterium]
MLALPCPPGINPWGLNGVISVNLSPCVRPLSHAILLSPHPAAVESKMTISQMLLPEFDAEMKNTRKILERIPEDKLDYKPHEKSMSLGRLAGHIAELPNWAKNTIELEVLTITPGQYKPY